MWSVEVAKKSNGVVKKNSGASLVDLGDGVACIEFHSKMNSLGGDIVSLITQTLKPGGAGDGIRRLRHHQRRRLISPSAPIVMLLLMSVQEEEWDEVDLAIRQFQGMTQAIKFSPKPVVVAPFGLMPRRRHGDHAARSRRGNLMPNSMQGWSKSASGCCPAEAAAKRCCCARWTARRRFVRRARRIHRTHGGNEESI